MWYVYVLKSEKNDRKYVGITADLRKRVIEHNKGFGSIYTNKNRPFSLIYYEAYQNKSDAGVAEKFYKTGYGREVLKQKLSNYLASK